MDGILICYKLDKKRFTQVVRNKFRKELLGYTDFSNNRKYIYKRLGLIDKIPHNKLIRSVFVIRKQESNKLIDFLEKYQADYFIREIKLTEDDITKIEQKEKS